MSWVAAGWRRAETVADTREEPARYYFTGHLRRTCAIDPYATTGFPLSRRTLRSTRVHRATREGWIDARRSLRYPAACCRCLGRARAHIGREKSLKLFGYFAKAARTHRRVSVASRGIGNSLSVWNHSPPSVIQGLSVFRQGVAITLRKTAVGSTG